MSRLAMHDRMEAGLASFDSVAANYEQLVTKNVWITGESSDYFASYKAAYIARRIAPPKGAKILDYGCGVGLLSGHLKKTLGDARIDGFDVSKESVQRISEDLVRQGTFSSTLNRLGNAYDVVVISNVLHHVRPEDRQELVSEAGSRLAVGGRLVIFEHNPINPLTQWAVSECPFDEDAILLLASEVQRYFQGRLRSLWRDYIVFFPRWLAWLRAMEPLLRACPLGAQYAAVAERQQ
jgi:2-polyprenyl-3-methyl-5-hydroxy-6-metoxy-1,4-benzoquinol methylase